MVCSGYNQFRAGTGRHPTYGAIVFCHVPEETKKVSRENRLKSEEREAEIKHHVSKERAQDNDCPGFSQPWRPTCILALGFYEITLHPYNKLLFCSPSKLIQMGFCFLQPKKS